MWQLPNFPEEDITNSLSATSIHFHATVLQHALLYSSQHHSAILHRTINLEKLQMLQNIYQILEHLESYEIIIKTIIVYNAFPTVCLWFISLPQSSVTAKQIMRYHKKSNGIDLSCKPRSVWNTFALAANPTPLRRP